MSNLPKKVVILVEDDETISSFLRLFLVGAGYEVFGARDGLEALSMITNYKPDVIITDLSMPRMDGIRLIKEIRARPERDLKTVPIIGVSGAAEALQVQAMSAGALIVLKKPIHRRTLLETVANVMKK